MTMCQFQTESSRHITDFYLLACFSATAQTRASLGRCFPFNLGSRINTYSTELRLTLSEELSSVRHELKAELSSQGFPRLPDQQTCEK